MKGINWKLSFGLIIISLIVCEVFVGLYYSTGHSFSHRLNPVTGTRENAYVPFRKRIVHTRRNRYQYFTNPDGLLFTQEIFSERKPKNTIRVMLLGGSNLYNGSSANYSDSMERKVEVIPCLLYNANYAGVLQNFKTGCSKYQDIDFVLIQLNLYPKGTTNRLDLGMFYGENLAEDPSAFNYLVDKKMWDVYSKEQLLRPTGVPYFASTHPMMKEYKAIFEPPLLYKYSALYRFIFKRIKNANLLTIKPHKKKVIAKLKLGSEKVLLNLLRDTKKLLPNSKFIISINPTKGFVDYYKENPNSKYMEQYYRFHQSAKRMGFKFFEVFKDLKKSDFQWDRRHFTQAYHHKIALEFQKYISSNFIKD
jgi:hypothetical protein